jgi:putative transposase
VISTIRQGLKDDGYIASVSQLCRWFGYPRRTMYYRSTKKVPSVQQRFAEPIKRKCHTGDSLAS